MRGRELEPSSFLPLKPAVFQILLVLSEGDAHGYGIKKEVEKRSDGTVRLEPGTLYRLISRLEADGLIRESDARPDPDADDERRRYYHLTETGRMVTAAEAERLAVLVDLARAQRLIKNRGRA